MKKAIFLLNLFFILLGSNSAVADIKNFKFGILCQNADGSYEMSEETTRIPKHLENTGFRFGISFDNPNSDLIEWYEIVRLPAPMKNVSGDLARSAKLVLTGATQKGNDSHVVDQYWFDEGDPVGTHILELYVNGVKKYSVNFEVTKAE